MLSHQSKKKARKSVDAGEAALYIALGTSKGGVSLYSYATGKVNSSSAHNLVSCRIHHPKPIPSANAFAQIETYLKGDGHSGRAVTAICRGRADQLFTCGEDCRIVCWSLSGAGAGGANDATVGAWKCGNDLPTCLTYLPLAGHLLVGTRELKLWSCGSAGGEAPALLQTYTGHTSNVNILQCLLIGDVEYVLSTSKMDRTISMWRCDATLANGSGKSGRAAAAAGRNAIATFLMADVAHYVSTTVAGDRLEVAAVTRSGVAHVFIIKDVNE